MTPRKVLIRMVAHRMDVASCYHTFPQNPPFERLVEMVRRMRDGPAHRDSLHVSDATMWFLGGPATREDYLKFSRLRLSDVTGDILQEGYDMWVASLIMEV